MNFEFRCGSSDIEIIPFKSELRDYFYKINARWIEEFFELEPIDERVLKNPEIEILDRGGAIYFARELGSGEVLGVCALMQHGDDWELTKMGVTPNAQGRGIGRKLAEAIIDHARRQGLPKLVLETNSRLTSAIGLYHKLGFVQVPIERSDYMRADVKMELILAAEV